MAGMISNRLAQDGHCHGAWCKKVQTKDCEDRSSLCGGGGVSHHNTIPQKVPAQFASRTGVCEQLALAFSRIPFNALHLFVL